MDWTQKVGVVLVADATVHVFANDDRQRYEFRINGAVCAEQSYCGIRCSQDDSYYADYLTEIFDERALRATRAFASGLGPIYV